MCDWPMSYVMSGCIGLSGHLQMYAVLGFGAATPGNSVLYMYNVGVNKNTSEYNNFRDNENSSAYSNVGVF